MRTLWWANRNPDRANLAIRALYFLKLAEQGKYAIPDRAVEELAAIVSERSETLELLINVDNPSMYAYRQMTELKAA